jgi:hypothetical protein
MQGFRRSALRPLAGLALAASVAVIAVLGFQGFVQRPGEPGALIADRRDPTPPAPTPADADFDRRLDAYLVSHSERTGANVHGILPYARIVAYDVGR